jgi:hypothetical protein
MVRAPSLPMVALTTALGMRCILGVTVEIRTKEDIQRLVDEATRETAALDFKQALPIPDKNVDLARDIAAMANAGGGTIVLGVGEKAGRARKVHPFNLEGAAERVASIALDRLDEPLVLDDIIDVPMGTAGEGLLVIEVGFSDRVPHFVEGQAWTRSGPRNVTMSRSAIGRLFASNSAAFLQEFGVSLGRPAAIRAKVEREREHSGYSKAGKVQYSNRHHLVLLNEGEQDAHDVRFSFQKSDGSDCEPPSVWGDDIVAHLPAGHRVEFPMMVHSGVCHTCNIQLMWTDGAGEEQSYEQTITVL